MISIRSYTLSHNGSQFISIYEQRVLLWSGGRVEGEAVEQEYEAESRRREMDKERLRSWRLRKGGGEGGVQEG